MKIIDNYSYISNYYVDSAFFTSFSTVKCQLRGSRFWKVSKDNSFTLMNDLTFSAYEKESKKAFLSYEGKMIINVLFSETDNDVEEIIEQIRLQFSTMKSFIFKNSLTFYSKLNDSMLTFQPTQQVYQMLKDEIAEIKAKKKFEELTEDELRIQENFPNIKFNPLH